MAAPGDRFPAGRTVVVFGGSGFLGRRVVDCLLDEGFSVRLAARHPRRPDRERLETIEADVNDQASVARAVEGCFGVVNAVSLYVERHGQTFHSVHVEAAERVAQLAKAAGVERLVHVSGIGADARSRSSYIASRGRGEEVVGRAFPGASLIRPAVMVGPEDSFVVPLAGLLRRFPVFALFGRGDTRLQPPHVTDVARAIACCFIADAPAAVYELGGPQVYRYRELLDLLRRHLGLKTVFIPLPFAAWQGIAILAEQLPSPPITRNQVALMRHDNVVSGTVPDFGALGIHPRRLEDALPEILP